MAERTAAQVLEALARGDQKAQVQLLQDGSPVSKWVTTPEDLDAAIAAALCLHPRHALRLWIQGPVD